MGRYKLTKTIYVEAEEDLMAWMQAYPGNLQEHFEVEFGNIEVLDVTGAHTGEALSWFYKTRDKPHGDCS